MFDEVKNNQVASPVNSGPLSAPPGPAAPVASAKAEDMFAEVDKSAKPEVFRPNQNNTPPFRGTVVPPATGWKSNKMIVFSLLFGGLIVVVAGSYFGLKLATRSQPVINNSVVQEQPKNTEAEAGPEIKPNAEVNNEVVEPPIQPIIAEPLDSDRDGLTDDEEISLSTDPNNSDTDQDGLTDREEAKVYKTDPLKADTDGDGFSDGAEIQNGYNPKGTGKLLEIK